MVEERIWESERCDAFRWLEVITEDRAWLSSTEQQLLFSLLWLHVDAPRCAKLGRRLVWAAKEGKRSWAQDLLPDWDVTMSDLHCLFGVWGTKVTIPCLHDRTIENVISALDPRTMSSQISSCGRITGCFTKRWNSDTCDLEFEWRTSGEQDDEWWGEGLSEVGWNDSRIWKQKVSRAWSNASAKFSHWDREISEILPGRNGRNNTWKGIHVVSARSPKWWICERKRLADKVGATLNKLLFQIILASSSLHCACTLCILYSYSSTIEPTQVRRITSTCSTVTKVTSCLVYSLSTTFSKVGAIQFISHHFAILTEIGLFENGRPLHPIVYHKSPNWNGHLGTPFLDTQICPRCARQMPALIASLVILQAAAAAENLDATPEGSKATQIRPWYRVYEPCFNHLIRTHINNIYTYINYIYICIHTYTLDML